MPGEPVEESARDAALAGVLAGHPEAVFAALGPDGFRVPMPESVGLAEHQLIPVPVDRATMIDLVVPADGMTMVTTWERGRALGVASGTVRTRTDPDRVMTLLFVDQQHRHGVMIGALVEQEGATENASPAVDPSLLLPLRPRTATVTKAWNAVITGVDDRFGRMMGWSAGEVVDARSTDFIHPDDHERALTSWMVMLGEKKSQRLRIRHRRRDGTWLWVETENVLHDAARTEDITVTTHITDISDEMAAHEALAQRERLFRRLAESLPFGLVQITSNGEIVYANRGVAGILGTGHAPTLDGRLSTVVEQDRTALDEALAQAVELGVDSELEIGIRMPATGELRRCAVTLIALTDQEGAPGALACLMDVTDSARMREELRAKATYDPLTGCYNRASTTAILDQALGAIDGGGTGVVFVDLNNFKPVNDRYGHGVGDELLVHVADTLGNLLRDGDVVGRLGGDEFLVVCRDLTAPEQAMAVGERVAEALHRTVVLSGNELTISASIGVAYAEGATTGDAVIAQADAAMYESKRRGDGRAVRYDAAA